MESQTKRKKRKIHELKTLYGENHPEVAEACIELAMVYKERDEFQKMIEFLGRARAIQTRLFGKEHVSLYPVLHQLGFAWSRLNKHEKAIKLYEKALVLCKSSSVSKEDYPFVLDILKEMGISCRALARYSNAIVCFEQALKIEKAYCGNTQLFVLDLLEELGLCWRLAADYKKAKRYYKRALRLGKTIYHEEDLELSPIFYNLGFVWLQLGKPKKAIKCHERALLICKANLDDDADRFIIAEILKNMADSYNELKKCQKAIELYEEAKHIGEAFYGSKHFFVADNFLGMAKAFGQLKEYKKTVQYAEQALQIYQTVYGEMHISTGSALMVLTKAFLDLGEKQKTALRYAKRAHVIFVKLLGKNHEISVLAEFFHDIAEHQLYDCEIL